MKPAKLIIGFVLALGLVVSAAIAHEVHGGPGRGAIVKRIATRRLDDALDHARVNDKQRSAIYAARDRVFAAMEQNHLTRAGDLDQVLGLFESDRFDLDRVAALRSEREANLKRVGDAAVQAVADAHAVLTPAQRHDIAEFVRAHRHGR